MAAEHRVHPWYLELLARVPSGEMTWMNLGLLDGDAPPLPENAPRERLHRCLNLVRQVLVGVNLRGASLLDVGCGRGGLCRYAKDKGARRVLGLDIILEQLQWCSRTHPAIRFVNADACFLPFVDAAFDVITSVESASHYADPDQFFRSAFRCLKRGGVFAVANIERGTIADCTARLERAGFDVRHCEDISDGVVRSIDTWAEVNEDMARLGGDPTLLARIEQEIIVAVRDILEGGDYRYLAWQAVKIEA